MKIFSFIVLGLCSTIDKGKDDKARAVVEGFGKIVGAIKGNYSGSSSNNSGGSVTSSSGSNDNRNSETLARLGKGLNNAFSFRR
jgi:hypothetical protein